MQPDYSPGQRAMLLNCSCRPGKPRALLLSPTRSCAVDSIGNISRAHARHGGETLCVAYGVVGEHGVVQVGQDLAPRRSPREPAPSLPGPPQGSRPGSAARTRAVGDTPRGRPPVAVSAARPDRSRRRRRPRRQQRVDVVLPPARITELERVAVARRQEGKEPGEPGRVGRKAWRQLEQDRAQLGAEGLDPARNCASGSWQSSRRRSWVMARHALTAKRKPGGVAADQRSTAAGVGSR